MPLTPPLREMSLSAGSGRHGSAGGQRRHKVVPGGPATGGVVQAKLLIRAGQPPAAVASALTAVGLLTTGVLLLLPVLTVPALIIGPPPDRQLQLGLLVSLLLAVVIVGLGVTALTWHGVLERVGRAVGYAIHVVRRAVSPQSVATSLVAQRDRVAMAFEGHWWRAVFASAANRMFDYAALVAALVAFGARARPAEVLLAYVVAQALALIPITPGGLGFVESGLTAFLVLIGISADTALIATLLYRLVSFGSPSRSGRRPGPAGASTAPRAATRRAPRASDPARGVCGQEAEEARRRPEPLPCPGHDDGADQGTDHPAQAQLEPVTGEQADQQPPDQGAEQARGERHRPVDAGRRPAQQHLRAGTDQHAEENDGDDQHASRIGEEASRRRGTPRTAPPGPQQKADRQNQAAIGAVAARSLLL